MEQTLALKESIGFADILIDEDVKELEKNNNKRPHIPVINGKGGLWKYQMISPKHRLKLRISLETRIKNGIRAISLSDL